MEVTSRELLSTAATTFRKQHPLLNIKQGHVLEVLVAILSEAPSWNVFVGQKLTCHSPTSVNEWFDAICRGETRLKILEALPQSDAYGRYHLCICMLDSFLNKNTYGESLWILLPESTSTVAEVSGFRKARVEDGLLEFELARLMFEKVKDHQTWDANEKLARESGFSNSQASLIRSVQREAIQHTWPIELWFVSGLAHSDQRKFLASLKEVSGWENYFEELLRTDGV